MTISKQEEQSLCSLLFETTSDYNTNLQTLLKLIEECPKDSFIVAPEVSLTGFDYDNFDAVIAFASTATEALTRACQDKTFFLTIIEKEGEQVFNYLKVFHNNQVIYQRAKAKLFRFGGEHHYFSEGDASDVAIFQSQGIKIGVLVCFELRFKELWSALEGCDLVVIPSWWGKARTEHFKTLTKALAILNQCYVLYSDSKNEECTQESGIITPQGKRFANGNTACLCRSYNKKEIALMRRYMDVGIG
jgi:omega-amidase